MGRQLHVHILSPDLSSPCLKNAKHWSSFQGPFLVSIDEIVSALECGHNLHQCFNLASAESQMKSQALQCHRCMANFKRQFAALKKHLALCSAPIPVLPPPLCWRETAEDLAD